MGAKEEIVVTIIQQLFKDAGTKYNHAQDDGSGLGWWIVALHARQKEGHTG